MIRALLMRFDAPLMAFGGTVVDARNVTDQFPARSLVTGMLANALGYEHRDGAALSRLQARLRVSARRDRTGTHVVDYQTVDLGQSFLLEGWTTGGRVEAREGGSAGTGTHIRLRHYLADTVYTVAVVLTDDDEPPSLDDLASALDRPVRPLFVGRKCCIPSERLLLGIIEAESLLDAVVRAPLSPRAEPGRKFVRVPGNTPLGSGFAPSERAVTEERDWTNQIHVGRQRVLEGFVDVGSEERPT